MRFFTSLTRLFLVATVACFISFTAKANVIITMPTGGQNISVDKAAAGTSPANVAGLSAGYTSLGNIVITAGAATDFQNGTRTITFSRPTGWRFEPNVGVGAIPFTGPNITAASITSVTATAFTVTYTSSGTRVMGNSITITGIKVQPISTNAALNPTGNITRTGGSAVVAGLLTAAQGGPTAVAPLSKVSASYSKLQILLPGQTNVPATTSGKSTNTFTTNPAGTAFDVVVNAVDAYWNIITTAPADLIQLASNSNGDLPLATALSGGTVTLNVNLKQSGNNRNITASNSTNTLITASTTNNFTVTAGAFAKMLITVPGQTYAAGTATGNTGTPVVTAGTAFSVTVRSVDDFFNLVSSTNTVNIAASGATNFTVPANAALSGGIRTFTNGVILRNASETPTLTATNVTDGTKTASTSPPITINNGAFTKLQILLPGETAAPGTTTGKTGIVTTPYASGTTISVIVNAVDANWNVVSTVTDIVGISSSLAAQSGLPANAALSGGTGSFNVTLTRAGSQTLTATDITDGTKTANNSPNFTVTAGAFVKLLVILPGETYAPGSINGKTGTPNTASPAADYTPVVVRGVDANWNTVTAANDIVTLTTSDVNGTITTNGLALSNGVRSFTTVRLRTAGNTTTITATYTNDLSKTAYTTGAITVLPGAFVKLQILVPGETANPGTATGKTGTPTAQTAGIAFPVIVNAVDANWNVVTTVTDVVGLTSTDPNAPMPANTALAAGTSTFNVTLTTASATQRRITATDITDGTKTSNTSPASPNGILVNVGAFEKLLVVLPGETYAPGTVTGKTGTPANQGAGVSFNVAVRAVDANWNLVNTVTDVVGITSSDGAAVLPANAALVGGVKTNFAVRLNTAGNQTVTATDITDGTKTAYTTGNILVVAPSSVTDFFRSAVSSGNWNNSSSWETSVDGIVGWQPATLSPTSASATITVRNTHSIDVVASVTVDEVVVENGATLNVNAGTLTIANGAGTDLLVNGTVSNRSTITPTGTIQFASTGRYIHAFTTTAGVVPTATWNAGSICEVKGYTTFAGTVGGTGQTFSDFIWNAPNQTAAGLPSLSGTFTTRNFTVLSTGSGALNLASAGGTVNITGDFYQSAGIVGINKTSGTATVNVNGNVSFVGGTLRSGAGTANFVFNATGTQLFNRTGSVMSGAINFSVSSTATVNFGSSIIGGAGTFIMQAGSTLITANTGGFAQTGENSGTIQVGGTRTYADGNYTYNGSSAQQTGTGLPLMITNLTINNAAGVSLPLTSSTYSVNGVLTINPSASTLNMNTNVLAGTFTNTGAGTLITAAATPFAAGKTWFVGVEYNSSSAQNIMAGTYNTLLRTSGAGSKTGPSGALNIGGDWSSTGGNVDLITNNTPISFNGLNQSISADNLLFRNVTFATSGTKTLTSGSFSVAETGTLTMANVASLNANGRLKLLSNASSTARVASIPSGASISGNVLVQRFVTGGSKNPYRTWRMFSSPVSDGSLNQYIDDILITGNGGASNGFDPSLGNAASAFGYNNGFVELTSLSAGGSPGKGVYMLYRGNRSNPETKITDYDTAADPESTIMSFNGTLNQGDVTVGLSSTGVNLLGNPYASTINWMFISKTGLTNSTIRIWNPSSRNYAVYDDGSISAATSLNGGSQFIPSGQAFFAAQGSSLTFTEGAKDSAQPATLLMATPIEIGLSTDQVASTGNSKIMAAGSNVVTISNPEVRLKLMKDGTPFSDEIVLSMKSGRSANYVVNEDIVAFGTPEVSLASISADNRRLAANRLPQVSEVSNVKLSIGGELSSKGISKSGTYHLSVNYSDLPTDYIVQIKDNFLNTVTAVPNGGSYAFNIDEAVAATTGDNRLSVSFVPPVTLPVTFSSFSATKVTEGVALKWVTSAELNNEGFIIERAGEDKVFKAILDTKAKGVGAYQLLDKNPLLGNNYYRLKQVDKDGTINAYDKIQVVNFSGVKDAALSVYPNPISDKFMVVYQGPLATDKQTLKVIGAAGQILFSKTVSKDELNNGIEINIGSFAAGVYILTITEQDGKQVDYSKLIKL